MHEYKRTPVLAYKTRLLKPHLKYRYSDFATWEMSHTVHSSQTAPVQEFRVLWTTQKKQKLKLWHDGFLRLHTFNNRMLLYDENRGLLADKYQTTSTRVTEGDEMQFEQHLVTIEEFIRTVVQDLAPVFSPAIQRRQQRATANFLNSASPDRGISTNRDSPIRPKGRNDFGNQKSPHQLYSPQVPKRTLGPALQKPPQKLHAKVQAAKLGSTVSPRYQLHTNQNKELSVATSPHEKLRKVQPPPGDLRPIETPKKHIQGYVLQNDHTRTLPQEPKQHPKSLTHSHLVTEPQDILTKGDIGPPRCQNELLGTKALEKTPRGPTKRLDTDSVVDDLEYDELVADDELLLLCSPSKTRAQPTTPTPWHAKSHSVSDRNTTNLPDRTSVRGLKSLDVVSNAPAEPNDSLPPSLTLKPPKNIPSPSNLSPEAKILRLPKRKSRNKLMCLNLPTSKSASSEETLDDSLLGARKRHKSQARPQIRLKEVDEIVEFDEDGPPAGANESVLAGEASATEEPRLSQKQKERTDYEESGPWSKEAYDLFKWKPPNFRR
ncbi:hypothetical protein EDC01DRAFT_677723 [Geopyxis carbonaria]|nr:hypothetical protein EDC01DRAFT_677723 [Geopyxis carbonaria]